jgi:hypothetical protein
LIQPLYLPKGTSTQIQRYIAPLLIHHYRESLLWQKRLLTRHLARNSAPDFGLDLV